MSCLRFCMVKALCLWRALTRNVCCTAVIPVRIWLPVNCICPHINLNSLTSCKYCYRTELLIIEFIVWYWSLKKGHSQWKFLNSTNVLPTTTVYPLGFGFLYTQCAAVTTQSGLIRDPPQICLPRARREICHGQEWGLASCPLITREKGGRTPHPVSQAKCNHFFFPV